MTTLRATAGRAIFVEATLTREGVAIDTTAQGFDAWFTLKVTKADPDSDAVFAANVTDQTITVNEPSSNDKNKITVEIPSTATAAFTESVDLFWDVVADDPASNRGPETVDWGVLKLTAPVTRVPE